ncbi:MAG: hypothetical protein ICV78_12615 [Tolypothrix sp. Co-bin9]|nr:hypothetical protein [Tolypothrix sp. Co-bin9]
MSQLQSWTPLAYCCGNPFSSRSWGASALGGSADLKHLAWKPPRPRCFTTAVAPIDRRLRTDEPGG